ncbi:MAG: acyltransferase [Patescibacteria group bacterium]
MEKKIDIFKAVAVIAVILIHFVSAYLLIFEKWGSLNWQLNLVIDQVSRFSVPLFVALSGYGLARKYLSAPLNLKDYYLRRVTKLLPWYFFWATVLLIVVPHGSYVLWKQYVFGRADYHLYFVPMIFQFYVLFPPVLFLVRKFNLKIVVLAALWQIAFYLIIGAKTENLANANRLWTDQQQYLLSITWIFYFILGIYWANAKKLSAKILIFIILIGLIWSITNSYSTINGGIHLITATRFTRLPVLLYSTGIIGLVIFYGGKISSGLFSYLGKISYVTYLGHTLVLRFLFDALGLQKLLPEPFVAFIAIVASFFTAAVLSKCYNLFHEFRD